MAARIATVAFIGVEARRVDVQVQISSGLVGLVIVGLPDKAVAESRERVRAAFSSMGAKRAALTGAGPNGHSRSSRPVTAGHRP